MKKDKYILTFNNILNDIGYAADGDGLSKRKTFNKEEPTRGVSTIDSEIQDNFDDLQGEGLKITFSSNHIDIWSK